MSEHAVPIGLDRFLIHRAWVRRIARSMVLDENDADDLEQGAWLSVLRRPPRRGRSIRGWLFTALQHDFTDWRRSEECRIRRERAHARAIVVSSSEDLVAEADVHSRVVAAVMDLKQPYRSTILHGFLEDIPPSVIAQQTFVPVETVRTRLRRALSLLRARFASECGGQGTDWSATVAPRAGHPTKRAAHRGRRR